MQGCVEGRSFNLLFLGSKGTSVQRLLGIVESFCGRTRIAINGGVRAHKGATAGLVQLFLPSLTPISVRLHFSTTELRATAGPSCLARLADPRYSNLQANSSF